MEFQITNDSKPTKKKEPMSHGESDAQPSAYGRRLLSQVFDKTSKSSPRRLYATISCSDPQFRLVDVTFAEMANGVNFLAHWLENLLGIGNSLQTICYIGIADLRYAIMFLAGMKCGYKTLFVSPRNTASINVSLLEQTGCEKLLYSSEMASIATSIYTLKNVDLFQIPSFEEMLKAEVQEYPYHDTYENASSKPIAVFHSSGSTGPPKAIVMTHGTFATLDNDRNLSQVPGRRKHDFTIWNFPGGAKFYSAFPPFHLAGFVSTAVIPIYTDAAVPVIGPPLKTPSAQVLRDIVSISQGQLKALFMPPSVAEQLLQELDGLALFRGIDFLCYAGGPLSQNAGDLLSGVTGLCQYYGSTETFQVQQLVPHPRDWAYMEWHPQSKIQMQPYSMENNVYELVVIPDESTAVYHIYPDLREYRTKDLFEQHPTKEKLWRFYGKTDDIIVLSNGQKVNPIPMEASLQANPMITRALVLGQGKPQVALLVELQHERQEEPAMFITDNLWTLIDRVNAQFPAHSRITRSKIIIGNSDKPLTCSAKGTILRKATAAAYENEVNLLYETELIKCASSISNLEKIRDQASIKDLVKASVGSLLPEMEFLGHEDLYSSGLDSLKTVELIQILQERLSNLTNEPPSFPNDFVYRNSTIDALSSALCRFLDISPESPTDMPTSPFSVAAMIEKYTADLGSGITVILTGSSGSLGSYILYELLHEPRITKIYCLDRSLHVKEKLMETYAGRYEDLSCINDTKVVFTQVDLTQKQFGLSISEFNELLHQTDIVIHNAWMVDFNMRLQSFEPLIQGVRSLIDFSIQSDRHSRIVFVSSVSSVQNASTQKVPQTFIEESILDDIDIASGTGYGESKYVAERILAIAHEMRQVPVSILRVGQIAGPIRTCGVWPSREWVPSLIQTSKTLSLLPEIDRAIDWIPIDTMAKVVLDISLSTNVHGLQVYNLINPSTTPWKTFLNPLHHELGLHVKVVPLVEWVGELERHDANDVAKRTFMPALKFLPFFRSIESATNEKHFITHNAVASSKTMAELGPVSEEWVMSWVQQLKCTWV